MIISGGVAQAIALKVAKRMKGARSEWNGCAQRMKVCAQRVDKVRAAHGEGLMEGGARVREGFRVLTVEDRRRTGSRAQALELVLWSTRVLNRVGLRRWWDPNQEFPGNGRTARVLTCSREGRSGGALALSVTLLTGRT